MKQPICRCCGKPIPKKTETVYCRAPGSNSTGAYTAGPLYDKAECQSVTNHQVVSVRYSDYKGRHVSYFSTWDGESYKDEFFCSDTCARRFAYVMARAGHCTKAYNNAVNKEV